MDKEMKNALSFEIEADELDIFLEDVNEHLQAMEAGVLRLEKAADPETLNAIFRAAHTLKAVAAAVGHRQMAELTHTVETLFDDMRQGHLSPTPEVTDELLSTVDVLKALRDEVVSLQPSDVDVGALLARLRDLAAACAAAPTPRSARGAAESEERRRLPPEEEARAQGYHRDGYTVLDVQIVACDDAFAPAARLLQAALALAEVGQIVAQAPSQADLANGQYEDGLWLVLATRSAREEVEALVRDISDLAEWRVQPYAHLEAEIETKVSPGAPVGLGEDKTVRISVERLDTLMNLVGELVTERTRLVQVEGTLRAAYGKGGIVGELGDMAAHLDRVVDQLQQEVMQARMLPVAHLFSKVPRLVRDVARTAGKKVDLVIEGEDTELDPSVIEGPSVPR
jgi:two-component system chemotaxis sensor kinase CheA